MADSSIGGIRVSLEAQVSQFIEGFTKAQYESEQSMRGIEGAVTHASQSVTAAVDGIKTALGALGVVLSFAAVGEFVKSTVAAAESLHNMAVVTGSSVESLSKLSNAAKITGVDFETFRTMVERMTSNMQTSSAESTKAQRALQFLGITARDPAQALQEVAVALDKYADGAGKAAIARDLFGKGGPEMVAALHAMAQAGDDLITTTTKDADAAAQLSEQMRLLAVQSTTLKNAVLREVVPALGEMVSALNAAKARTGSLVEALSALASSGIVSPFTSLGEAIKNLRGQIEDQQKYIDEKGGFWARLIGTPEAQKQSVDLAVAEIARLKGALNDLRKIQQDQALALLPGVGRTDPRDLPFRGEKDVLTYASAAKDAIDKLKAAQDAYIAGLVDQLAKLTLTKDKYEEWKATLLGVGDRTEALRKNVADATETQAQNTAALAVSKTLWEQQDKAFTDARKSYSDYQLSLDKGIDSLKLEAATVGMSSVARQIYITNAKLAKAIDEDDTITIGKLTEQLKLLNQVAASTALVDAAKQAQEAWKKTATQIEDALVNAFMSVLTKGKDLFQQLKDFALALFKDLVLRPILAPISGAIAGLLYPGAAGAAEVPNIFSGLGSLFGLGGAASSAYPGGAGAMVLGGGDAAIGSVLPAIGIALAAITLFSSLFSSSGHGPKSGGYASIGDISGLPSGAGPGGRYYTPTDADATLQTAVGVISDDFRNALSALGGKGTAGFALGYDIDPHGTAGGRVSAGVQVGGQTVFNQLVSGLGSDQAAIQAALTTASQRALLAALQASDMPVAIARLLNSVVASTASATAVQNIIAQAEGLKLVTDLLAKNPIKDALDAIKTSSQSASSAVAAAGEKLLTLAANYDRTAASSQALATATQQYYNAVVATIAQIEQIKTSITGMFAATIRSMTLSTLDAEGKKAFFRADELQAEALLASATDPATIQALSTRINDDFNAVFGLLSPAEQAAQLGQFTHNIGLLNDSVTARLAKIQQDTADRATQILTTIQTAFADAGKKMGDAADIQLAAANTPIDVDITFTANVPGNAEVNPA